MSQERLVSPGSFCWNKECPDYGRVNQKNIRRYGKTRRGVQRYQCSTCKATFTETKGTIFYGCHTPAEKIIECLALLAERNSLAAVHRLRGVKEETQLVWLQKAASHIEETEERLLANYQLTRAQLDSLWTYVGHKGEKGGTPKRRSEVVSGVAQ